MKDYTELLKKLLASPSLEEPSNFDLDNEESNIARTEEFIHKSTVIRTFNGGLLKLYRYTAKDLGNIFLVDTKTGRSTYFMEYMIEYLPVLKHKSAAFQTLVWVSKESPRPRRGFAADIVIRYLIRQCHFVISDQGQTSDGKRFWHNLLRIAYSAGYEIGLLDLRVSNRIKCVGDFDEWYESVSYAYSYQSSEHYRYRFYIESHIG
jgi:hypothetical protein